MKKIRKIAFFAPIKPPDHPIPSGDRLIAGNLMKAFTLADFEPELASRYICYSKRSNPDILTERKQGALAEAARVVDALASRAKSDRPDLWVTYHPYCKAPDWIGPVVSKALDIPYVTIEAAKTGQGENDEWLPWRKEAQKGIRDADLHLCFKPTDKAYLTDLLGDTDRLRDFPAFIDTEAGNEEDKKQLPSHWKRDTPILVTTGMMRPGKKVKNFELLAEVLEKVTDQKWNLIVIGGGPELDNIRAMFKGIQDSRMFWTGQVEHSEVLQWMRASDVFIWPGWKEPIGMVYLEAQLQGLPVIASKSMGVPLVVEDEVSGLLSGEGDVNAMAENLLRMLSDKNVRQGMGKAARQKVLQSHSLEAAASRLKEIFKEIAA